MPLPGPRLIALGLQPVGGTNWNAPQLVASIAALRALSVAGLADGASVLLLGGAAVNDGLQGHFRYLSTSIEADDGLTVIQPTVGAGRWIRQAVTHNAVGADQLKASAAIHEKIEQSMRAKAFATYAAARAQNYANFQTGERIHITNRGIAGFFLVDKADGVSADDSGVVLVAADGTRLHRVFSGAINVQWFGADWTGATDCAAAFQAAINKAAVGDLLNARRGCGVFIPGGDYRINSKVTLKTGVRIYGESRQSVRILSYVANDDLFFYDAAATALNVAKDVAIDNFSIIGEVVSNGAYIRITGDAEVSFPTLACLYIYGNLTGNYGIRANATIDAFMRSIVVQGCASHGFYFQATNNGGVFNSCYATGNGGDGWNITGTQMTLNGCSSDSNIGHGYRLAGTGFTINSPEAEDNHEDIIYLAGTYNVSINNGVLYGSASSKNGITLDGAVSVSIVNTQIATQGGVPSGYTLRYINDPAVITRWQLITEAFTLGTFHNPGNIADVSMGTSANLRVRGLTVLTKSFFNDMNLQGLVPFANNAAAIAGGLVAGDPYILGDSIGIVH